MKLGLIGDLHVDISGELTKFEFVKQAILDFKQECLKRDIKRIVMLGDLFHAKVTTSTEILIKTAELINDLSKHFYIYLIVGNHDIASISESNLNLPNVFQGNANINVIEDYFMYEIDDIVLHFQAYGKFGANFFNAIHVEDYKNYLFGHFGINGFVMQGDNITDNKSDVTPKHLEKFDGVFLGHFHGYQTEGNITYVGSPIQLRHGDELMPHGFVFVDTRTNDFEFIEYDKKPNFLTIKLTKKSYKKLLETKDSYIRILLNKKLEKQKIISLRDQLLKNNFDVTFVNDFNESHEFTVVEGWDEIIKQDEETTFKKFLEKNKTTLDENEWKEKEMLKLVLDKE